MKRTLIAAALLLAACEAPTGGKGEVNGGKPPERFQGDATVRVQWVGDVQAACHAAGLRQISGTEVHGCAVLNGPNPRVILKNPCRATGASARAACHELGHANGWPPLHGK